MYPQILGGSVQIGTLLTSTCFRWGQTSVTGGAV